MKIKKKKKKPTGRPPIELDWETFEKLCALHCTLAEISGFMNCSDDTIERKVLKKYGLPFAEVFRQKASNGKISLRRKMYEMARAGDKTMLIWLSKQYMGMSEKVEQKTEVKHTEPVQVVIYRNGSEADE